MRNCCKLCLSLVCYSVRDRVRFGLHGSASSDREITCTSHNHKTAYRDTLLLDEIHIEQSRIRFFRLDSDTPRILFLVCATHREFISRRILSQKNRNYFPPRWYILNKWQSLCELAHLYKDTRWGKDQPYAFAVNLVLLSSWSGIVTSSLICPWKEGSLWLRSGLIKGCRMHYPGKGGSQWFSAPRENTRARAVRSTREKHRRWAITRAHKNRSRATAYVKKTIRGGALRCCWLAARIAPVPRKRGLMIEPAPLIYALRHTLHRGFVFRDRLVNKIFCNSGLRHFALPSPPAVPVVCFIIENRHKLPKPRDNIPRLSWSLWTKTGSNKGHNQESERWTRGGHRRGTHCAFMRSSRQF